MRPLLFGMFVLYAVNVPVRLNMFESPGDVMAFLDACRSLLWLGIFFLAFDRDPRRPRALEVR